jgi:hypothetical protein
MILGWSPFKIVSVRWPPLLKIEIYSNGQNCSILSQKVPKFELGTFWLKIEQFWPFEKKIYFWKWGPLWIQDGTGGHKFERGPTKDHFSRVWLRLSLVSEEKIFFKFDPPFFLTDYAN